MQELQQFIEAKKETCSKDDKKAIYSPWLSPDAGVHALFKEYVGMTQDLRIMREDRVVAGAQTDGLLKNIDNPTILRTLYMLKLVLSHLLTLSKTFQEGSLNFSRISPNIEKTIHKMLSIEAEWQPLNTLMLDITEQLEECKIALNENQQEIIARLATQYVNALERSIRERFPTEIINLFEALHIFGAGMVPEESEEFEVFGNKEVQIFKNHYYKGNIKKAAGLENQWDDFKYEMVTLKKKWISFK